MQKSEHIVAYTWDELNEKVKREGTLTDWARVAAMTDEEIEAAIDHDEEGEFDLADLGLAYRSSGMPKPLEDVTLRLDGRIVDWFKAQGDHYQLRMAAVLHNYVEDQKEKARAK
jgi:uncharacterized protein (DUF4415 family)